MKLYYSQTPNALRACTVAKYLNAPVEFIQMDLAKGQHKQPDYLAINPNGKVPALTDGDFCLWEAPAIMAYIAQKQRSDLWPGEPAGQIETLKWINWDTAHFSRHAGRLWFQNFLKPMIGHGDPDPAEIEDATGYFVQFAAILNDQLAARPYLTGENMSIADFAVATYLALSEQARLPLDGLDHVERWSGTMMKIDALRDPWPAAPGSFG